MGDRFPLPDEPVIVWTSTKDALPAKPGRYLVHESLDGQDSYFDIADFNSASKKFEDNGGNKMFVTHWTVITPPAFKGVA